MMYILLSEKIRKELRMKYEIVRPNDYAGMETRAIEKIEKVIPILYKKFLTEEWEKCVQVYIS